MANFARIRLILELHDRGMSQEEISRSRHMSRSTITTVLRTARKKGITYAGIRKLDDAALQKLFFPDRPEGSDMYELPDYESIHKELKKPGVTLSLLWTEYRDRCHQNGNIAVGHTKFCEDYGRYCTTHDLTNHLEHKPGAQCEVDWSGPTMQIIDRDTGATISVHLFVSCLTYSRYAYVEATLDMKMDTWLRCHVHMYEAFGGVPVRTVCDNLKTGVVKHPKEGEVVLTDAYEALGLHYSTAIMPAGVRKPKQKASVENTVGNIATAIIARLRNKVYFTLGELQKDVVTATDKYNRQPFQKRQGSRYEVWLDEKKYLRALPRAPYEIASVILGRKVYPNFHVSFKKNWYSVPYVYRGQSVDIRYTDKLVEIYCGNRRIASHIRFPDYMTNHYSTRPGDMPDAFNQPEMDKDRICAWAEKIGPCTSEVIRRIFDSVTIKEQGYNAALAVLHLSQKYPKDRFENACQYALAHTTSPRYNYLKAVLGNNQDKILDSVHSARYENTGKHSISEKGAYIRGADYYGGKTK